MTPELWIALASAKCVTALVPGQNSALMAVVSARFGWTGGILALLGILMAQIVWAIVAIYVIFSALDLVGGDIIWLQTVSAILLIWIGSNTLRVSTDISTVKIHRRAFGHVFDGVVVGIANPMTLMFFLALFPAFVQAGTAAEEVILFTVSAVLASTAAALAPYLLVGGLVRRAGHGELLHLVSGSALVVTGGFLLLHVLG